MNASSADSANGLLAGLMRAVSRQYSPSSPLAGFSDRLYQMPMRIQLENAGPGEGLAKFSPALGIVALLRGPMAACRHCKYRQHKSIRLCQ